MAKRSAVGGLVRIWKREGPGAVVEAARAAVLSTFCDWVDRRFDQRYRLDTSQMVSVSDLPIPDADRAYYDEDQGYEPASIITLHGIISALPIDPRDYVFVDFGSGKGRAVLIASRYPFKKVIGIELSPDLHEAALMNKRRYTEVDSLKCADVSFVNVNAVDYALPAEQSVFYFYNSFPAPVMLLVLENIRRSYWAQPRKCYLAYLNPRCSRLFKKMDFIRCIRRQRLGSRYGMIRSFLYETVA